MNGKFAPPAGKALLLVGQDQKSIDSYFDATVTAPGGVAANTDLQLKGIENVDYLAEKYPKSVLSVSIDLKDAIGDIAAGNVDAKIDALLDTLTSYNRPVFLRIGFGLDDAPDVYVSAWKKFYERIQANGSTNLALVWESDSCEESDFADWYPSDEFVDWIGISYCDGKSIETKIQFAREHLKPVMVTAESNATNWNEWFASFFQFVNDNNDVVRAVMYINDIPLNDELLKRWKDETKQSFWLRANPKLFGELGFTK